MGDIEKNLKIENKPNGIQAQYGSDIKKLSKFPLVITFVLVALIVISLMYSLSQRGVKRDNNVTNEVMIINSDPTDNIRRLENKVPVVKQSSPQFEMNNTLPVNMKIDTPTVDEYAAKQEALRKQMAIDALKAPTRIKIDEDFVNPKGDEIEKTSATNSNGDSLIENLINQNKTTVTASTSKSNNSNDFFNESKKSFDYLPFQKTAQLSLYELKTGSVIPGVLISGINSELPGMIIGQVSENVYDTATGEHLLIPQGARLVGQYSPNVSYGQNRVLIAWNRIIFPNGDTLNLEAMNGTDQAGYAGFEDQVNHHYFRVFGSALLISLLGGELSFSNGKISFNESSSSSSNENTVMSVGNTMLQKNLGIAPTIEIRSGYKFNIFVTKDMIIKPDAVSGSKEKS